MNENASSEKMYQVSTLSALALGYTRTVVKVRDLLQNGDTGLGTFENCDGEMIVVDGHCYRAADDGSVSETPADLGVPFASVVFLKNQESERPRLAFCQRTSSSCFSTSSSSL